MKPLLLTLSAILLLTLAGWGQTATGQQAHASVAAHRRQAKEHAARHRQHHQRQHHHHRRHGKA
jgi:ABC-type nickel/cobalt efflux system permease component RcnA